MKIRKQHYIRTWIAFSALIIAVTALLNMAWRPGKSGDASLICTTAAWLITVSSATALFVTASQRALVRRIRSQEVVKPQKKPVSRKKSAAGEDAQLDIQTVAGKITRRTDPSGDPEKWGRQLLDLLVSELEIMSGVIYTKNRDDTFEPIATYAISQTGATNAFREGEGLPGQTVKTRQVNVYRNIPDAYTRVFSGLGSGKPAYLAIMPLEKEEEVYAVIEVAGYRWSESNLEQFFQLVCRDLSKKRVSAGRAKQEDDT